MCCVRCCFMWSARTHLDGTDVGHHYIPAGGPASRCRARRLCIETAKCQKDVRAATCRCMRGKASHLILDGAVLVGRYRTIAERSGGEEDGCVFGGPCDETL